MNRSLDPNFAAGMFILGKWNKRKYQIIRPLGEGSNGKVYLVKNGKTYDAMKLGFSALELQSEVNALKSLTVMKKGDPYLIDVDDFYQLGQDYPFYVMKYVNGVGFMEYLRLHGEDWIYIIGRNILEQLQRLHERGWIFGDLKMDNIIVSGYGEVELIDYGGVTPKGRSVKQFTEIYDRGYWGAGTRTADEGYDLFSFALLCLQCADNIDQRLSLQCLPSQCDLDYLMEITDTNPLCAQIAPFLHKAFQGKFSSSKQAGAEWRKTMLRMKGRNPQYLQVSWLKVAFAASAAAFATTLYLIFQ